MKQEKKPTRRDKKAEHGTVSNYRRVQKEKVRSEEANRLNKEINNELSDKM